MKGSICFKTRLTSVVNDARSTTRMIRKENHHLGIKIKYTVKFPYQYHSNMHISKKDNTLI